MFLRFQWFFSILTFFFGFLVFANQPTVHNAWVSRASVWLCLFFLAFLSFLVSVLLSAHVKSFSFSRTHDIYFFSSVSLKEFLLKKILKLISEFGCLTFFQMRAYLVVHLLQCKVHNISPCHYFAFYSIRFHLISFFSGLYLIWLLPINLICNTWIFL